MILLDKPLVSEFLKQSIRQGQFQALDTGRVTTPGEIPLLRESEVIEKMRAEPNINLHTISENALAWIYKNLDFTGLPEKISLFKNKLAFRKLIAAHYPGFFFREAVVSGMDDLDISSFPKPFIIKPAIGFFSMGVHKVFDEQGWTTVKAAIKKEVNEIRSVYPDEVLSLETYIAEQCLEGDEYAFDAYFDDDGRAHILGVMEHPFGGEQDVSDRVYNTSAGIVQKHFSKFEGFLEMIGKLAGLRNFSLHTEVRIDEHGNLVPIEVNPLRFGAWCTSADLMHYAFGFNPYSYYINNIKPDWDEILSASDGAIYSIIILDNSTGIPAGQIQSFDFNRLLGKLSQPPLELRKIDYHLYPIFGILFTRTSPENYSEIETILHDDLRAYVK